MSSAPRFEAGLQRNAAAEPLPIESEPELVARIRAEIALSGPITFARFMAIALYDPDHGYYRGAIDRPSRSGDFLTAPELHPIFGTAIARQVAEVWERLGRPDPFVLREYGAGSGTLAATIVAGLKADGSALTEALAYEPVEVNPHRQAEIAERLGALVRPQPASAETPFNGVVLANEFLDALPVHRVTQRDGGLAELFVDWEAGQDRFVERPGEPSSPALAARLADDGVQLVEGQVGEICLEVERWIAEISRLLTRGLVLVIDYGHPAPVLYDSARIGGSLRAYAGQRAHADPFIAIGRQDLTAHVDLTAFVAAARASGFDLLGEVSQAELLVGCGLEELLDRIRSNPATTMEEWLAARSAIARLLDPAVLGGFRAVLLGRGLDPAPPLLGLTARRPVP